ncbi:hypothetical protein [Spirosoma aerophilum]
MIHCQKGVSTVTLLVLFSIHWNAQVPTNYPANYAKAPRFKALLYFNERTEKDHVIFAHQTINFLKKLSVGDGFILDTTQNFGRYPYEKLKEYQLLIIPNGYPSKNAERAVFEQYMEAGGGWMGFTNRATTIKIRIGPGLLPFWAEVYFIATIGPLNPLH